MVQRNNLNNLAPLHHSKVHQFQQISFNIHPKHLIHILDAGNHIDGRLQFFRRMYRKVNGSFHDTVDGYGCQLGDRQVLLFRHASYHIAQQMIPVYSTGGGYVPDKAISHSLRN